jgi:hypothetical protein
MPLLEIAQSRQISASVRLDEATATQVDQYAAFIKATADDVVDKALNYVFAKDRDFQDFLKTPETKQISSPCGFGRRRVPKRSSSPRRRRRPARRFPWNQCGRRRRDSAFNSGVERRRCFAPDEL